MNRLSRNTLICPPAALEIITTLQANGHQAVLAGGCVVGSLYRMGGGSTLSATAVAGLIVGSLAYVELDGWWLPRAKSMSLGSSAVTLPQLLQLLLLLKLLLKQQPTNLQNKQIRKSL